MKHRAILIIVMLLLLTAAIVVPLAMHRLPMALRWVASFTNLTAALAIGALLWQRRRRD